MLSEPVIVFSSSRVGIASEVPLQFLTVGGLDFPTALLDTTTFLASSPQPPTVMTTS
jgi:tripeptidyl-peptidase-1